MKLGLLVRIMSWNIISAVHKKHNAWNFFSKHHFYVNIAHPYHLENFKRMTNNTTAQMMERLPTTIYATPKKLFLPPSHDFSESTKYFVPSNLVTG